MKRLEKLEIELSKNLSNLILKFEKENKVKINHIGPYAGDIIDLDGETEIERIKFEIGLENEF